MAGERCLCLLPGSVEQETLLALLRDAHAAGVQRTYVYLPGFLQPAPTPSVLRWLGVMYSLVAHIHACMDVVPLLPFAGWTPDAVGALSSLESVVVTGGTPALQQGLLAQLQRQRPAGNRPLQQLDVDVAPAPSPLACGAQQQQHQQQQLVLTSGEGEAALAFDRVAVGGTFDRLHAGHRLLLAATALTAARAVFAGVTADALLANKSDRALLQPFDKRCERASEFMRAVRPGLAVATGALSDPAAPTQAEVDPGMQALVVSKETLRGGEAINVGRLARGLAPLHLVVVGLVGGEEVATKVSSSALRAAEARRRDTGTAGTV